MAVLLGHVCREVMEVTIGRFPASQRQRSTRLRVVFHAISLTEGSLFGHPENKKLASPAALKYSTNGTILAPPRGASPDGEDVWEGTSVCNCLVVFAIGSQGWDHVTRFKRGAMECKRGGFVAN